MATFYEIQRQPLLFKAIASVVQDNPQISLWILLIRRIGLTEVTMGYCFLKEDSILSFSNVISLCFEYQKKKHIFTNLCKAATIDDSYWVVYYIFLIYCLVHEIEEKEKTVKRRWSQFPELEVLGCLILPKQPSQDIKFIKLYREKPRESAHCRSCNN